MLKFPKHLVFSILLFARVSYGEQVGPWNTEQLKNTVPAMHWIKQEGSVRSLLYAGENYKGKPTEVYAVYASPITVGDVKEAGKFPAVVLIHGGGGTAFAEWVYLWAKRGYAAIAMDLAGSQPPDLETDPKTGAPNPEWAPAKVDTPPCQWRAQPRSFRKVRQYCVCIKRTLAIPRCGCGHARPHADSLISGG